MPPIDQELLGHGACLTIAAACGLAARTFTAIEPLPLPPGGPRGDERKRLLRDLGRLQVFDAFLRRGAVLVSPLLGERQRSALQARLERAGDLLGLGAEEWAALCAVVTLASAALGAVFCSKVGWNLGWAAGCGVLGTLGCFGRMDGITRERVRAADRELPSAIDLIAMCMGAGMDFPGAVRLVVGNDARGVVARELRRVLRDLSLGRTRREALVEFGRRLPSSSVLDFVAAAVQAEQKGTPLSDVLANQAVVSRIRRSVATEEAAARAGVLLIIPLMLLMGCIILLLVGPLAVKGAAL